MTEFYDVTFSCDNVLDYAEHKYGNNPNLMFEICSSILEREPDNIRALELLLTHCIREDNSEIVIGLLVRSLHYLPCQDIFLSMLRRLAVNVRSDDGHNLTIELGRIASEVMSTNCYRTGNALQAEGRFHDAIKTYLEGIEFGSFSQELYSCLHVLLQKYPPPVFQEFTTRYNVYRIHVYFVYDERELSSQTVYLDDVTLTSPLVFSIVSPWGPIANNCRTFPLFYQASNITLRKNSHQFTIFHENGSIIPTSYLPAVSPTPDNPYVAADRSQALFRVSQSSVEVSEPLVVIDSCLQCFGHFMHDYLPYMLLACRQAETKNCRILVPSINANEERFLSHLGIPREKIITWHELSVGYGFPEALEIAEAYLPIHLPLPVVIEVIRSAFNCSEDRYADGSGRRIFISRKFTPNVPRRIENEDELSAALAVIGFETVVPEFLTVDEQVRLFSEASIIVGAGGSGSFSQVWAPRGAAVILLMSVESYEYAIREILALNRSPLVLATVITV